LALLLALTLARVGSVLLLPGFHTTTDIRAALHRHQSPALLDERKIVIVAIAIFGSGDSGDSGDNGASGASGASGSRSQSFSLLLLSRFLSLIGSAASANNIVVIIDVVVIIIVVVVVCAIAFMVRHVRVS
jgi:hypothetical protein